MPKTDVYEPDKPVLLTFRLPQGLKEKMSKLAIKLNTSDSALLRTLISDACKRGAPAPNIPADDPGRRATPESRKPPKKANGKKKPAARVDYDDEI